MGMKGQIALSAVVGVVVIGVVSANAGNSDGGSGSSGTHSSASTAHQPEGKKNSGGAEAAEEKAAFDGDGDYQVGSDIKPGTYRTTGNTDGMCHWERTADAGQGPDSVIAHNNVTGTALVTIRSTDAYFRTTGCSDWKRTA
ncbi:hypothetical protein ABZ471_06895 [Streptomyces sp. NPDC005728]|uniref:hypothetical protein n=1 Tax=Streptomyces sp. NPDC005728 TaxID=3157054 RepID=UPI0033D736D0